jgi:hypothetical protein
VLLKQTFLQKAATDMFQSSRTNTSVTFSANSNAFSMHSKFFNLNFLCQKMKRAVSIAMNRSVAVGLTKGSAGFFLTVFRCSFNEATYVFLLVNAKVFWLLNVSKLIYS